ncbi:MAG TPA: MBL fold metallo-hydrolase [Burkholderiaceae bacterium]|nr:MBL fold metallo-hydrolase [Burkholderiaceae bacterium]
MKPLAMVRPFVDGSTGTVTYVVSDIDTRHAAIIDPVLNYEARSGRTGSGSADRVLACVHEHGLTVQWILETHIHADHLSGAHYLKERIGGKTAISEKVREVQATFKRFYRLEPTFPADGSQFDHLFRDGDRFRIGNIEASTLLVPGHTPADLAYLIDDAAFVGDTLFMPDLGSARSDFPGGDAQTLYRSIRRLLALPPETRVFVGHDYPPHGRRFQWETTVSEQRAKNVHVRDGITEQAFIALRQARDATLKVPDLMLHAIQINMRAGRFPRPEENGVSYLRLPLNLL